MAKFTSGELKLKDNQRIVFGTGDDSAAWWDGSELRLNTVISGVYPINVDHLATKQYVDLAVTSGSVASGTLPHSWLTGLSADDHPQYHTDARGDIRYYTQGQVTTISGDIIDQIPSLVGYATEGYVNSVSGALNLTKSDVGHNHDSRYYTEAEVDVISGAINSKIIGIDLTPYVKTDGSRNITGQFRFEDAVIIDGNLTVSGTTFHTAVENVEIDDNLLIINYGETASGVTVGTAGIQVDRGTADDYFFLFDEATDTFRVGISGGLQPVATRENSPITSGLAYWNPTEYRFDTSNTYTITTLSDWLNQSVKTTASPTFVTTKLSGLTDSYLPYHVNDSTGFADSLLKKDDRSLQFYNSSTANPNIEVHIGPANYDNCGFLFDAYSSNSEWFSSCAGSNYLLYKTSDLLTFFYSTGVPVGSGISTWTKLFELTNAGNAVMYGETSAAPTKGWLSFGTTFDSTAFSATDTNVTMNKIRLFDSPDTFMGGFGVSDSSVNIMSSNYFKFISGYTNAGTGVVTALMSAGKMAIGNVKSVPAATLEVHDNSIASLILVCKDAVAPAVSYEYIALSENAGATDAYIIRYNSDYETSALRNKLHIKNPKNTIELWPGDGVTAYQGLVVSTSSGSSGPILVEIGTNDTACGSLYLYGAVSGTNGSELRLFLNGDNDAVVNHWAVKTYEDDLIVGPDTFANSYVFTPAGDLFLNNGSIVIPNSEYVNFSGVLGSTGYGFRDNSGTMEYKDNGGSWTAFSGTGTMNHSSLSGLDSDDHTQYMLVNGNRGFTNTVSGVAPVESYHLATKGYVDQGGVDRHGRQTISNGVSFVDVSFTSVGTTNYTVNATLQNTSDSPPSVYAFIISSTTASGFRATFMGDMDSANYMLNWSILVD